MSSFFGRASQQSQNQNASSPIYPQLNQQQQQHNQQQPPQWGYQPQQPYQQQQIAYGQPNAGPSQPQQGQMQPYHPQPQHQYGSVGPYQGSQQQLQQQQPQQGGMQGYQQNNYVTPYPAGEPLAQNIDPPTEGSTDSARIFGALQKAKNKIDRAIRIDDHISPDLADKAGGEYPRSKGPVGRLMGREHRYAVCGCQTRITACCV